MNEPVRQVFFSYAWGGESERIVNELDADLQARGIVVVRDKRDLGYKGKIREFMQEIGRAHAIVVVVSDKYLRSPNCMFELVEIAKSRDIHDRVFPVVLQDADIYKEVNSIKYVKHWEDEFNALNQAMSSLRSQANLQGQREALDNYDAFRDHVSRLTDLFKNMNALTPEMHENSNFSSLIGALERRLEAAAALPSAPPPVTAAAAPAAGAAASRPGAGVDVGAYLAEITQRLTKDKYEPMKGERFGPLKFRCAFERVEVRKGFLGTKNHFRVLALEERGLSKERFLAIEEQVKKYAREQYGKKHANMFVTCVVLTEAASDELKDLVYQLKPPKLGITDGCISTMAVYSAAENDIAFPTELLDDLGSNFEENIKKYLAP